MKFVCEYCGKSFNTAEEAQRCEKIHKDEDERRKKENADERKIIDAIKEFEKKYDRSPLFPLWPGMWVPVTVNKNNEAASEKRTQSNAEKGKNNPAFDEKRDAVEEFLEAINWL